MTIRTEYEYESTKKVLTLVEKALRALQKDSLPDRADEYAAFSGAYLNQIRKLRDEIDEYLGLHLAEEQAMSLWVNIQGPQITDKAPVSVLFEFLRDFRYGIFQIAKYNARVAGHEPLTDNEIRQMTNARVKVMPGSLRIGFSLPPTQSLIEGTEENLPKRAIEKMLDGALLSSTKNKMTLEQRFPDPVERRLVLGNVEKLSSMRGGQVTKVVFRGKLLEGRRIAFTKQSSRTIRRAMEKDLPSELTKYEGVVRKIDLDKKEFALRRALSARKTEKRQCRYELELEDEVKGCLDKKVRVIGESEIAANAPIRVRMIELKETEE